MDDRIKRIEKIRTEEIRARADVSNIREKIRKRLRCLGHVERKTEEMLREHGNGWTPKDRNTETEVERCYKKRHEGERRRDKRSTRPENVDIENSMRRP